MGKSPRVSFIPWGRICFTSSCSPGLAVGAEYHLGVEFCTRCLAATSCEQAG